MLRRPSTLARAPHTDTSPSGERLITAHKLTPVWASGIVIVFLDGTI